MLSLLYLIFMSLIAGILTGIVGMAAVTLYPVLLSVGVMPVTANATITVSMIAGGMGTVLSSLRELKNHWKQAIQIAVVNTIGGVLGAWILIHSSNRGFQKVVPFFILMAGIMILAPKKKPLNTKSKNRRTPFLGWIAIGLVGIYIGYFGAGAGLLMIAVLSHLVDDDYAIYNAMRNFSAFMNNSVSAIMFTFMLPIDWQAVIPLIIGLFVGGYIGPIIVRYIPSKVIEVAVGVFAIGLSFFLGYQAFIE